MHWAIGSTALVLVWVIPARTADPPAKITPVVVWTGTDSSLSKPEFVRCQTAAEWDETWARHSKDNRDYGRAAAQVDFGSFMVVAIFEGGGETNSGLRMVEILEEPDCLRVRYYTAYYQDAADLEESEADRQRRETRNYAFLVIPRSNKAITFESGRRRTIDDPEKEWQKVGSVPVVTRK